MTRLRCTATDPTGRVHTSPAISRPYTHAVVGRHCFDRAVENARAPIHAHLDGERAAEQLTLRLAHLDRLKAEGFFDHFVLLGWTTRPALVPRLHARALGIFGEAAILVATQEAAL